MATTFPNSPNHAKGYLKLMDPNTGSIPRTITLQINPSQLTRSLQVQGAGGEGGDRSEALRLTGPPVETIQLEAELDATDQLEFPQQNENTVEYGLLRELAALESLVYPDSTLLRVNNLLAEFGMLEILPVETPLTLFGWGKNREMPVRLKEISITEQLFDQQLNPIRATVTLGMQILSVNDLPFNHRGSSLYLQHHQLIERLAQRKPASLLQAVAGFIPQPPRRIV